MALNGHENVYHSYLSCINEHHAYIRYSRVSAELDVETITVWKGVAQSSIISFVYISHIYSIACP